MVLIALMTCIILTQVFFRYFLNDALIWPEEVAKFMMVWMTFLVAPDAYRKGMNVSMEALTSRLPPMLNNLLALLVHGMVLTMGVILFQEGMGMVERGGFVRASSVDITMDYIYFILPLSFAMVSSAATECILKNVTSGSKVAA
jgi:TRAP-type C4-dicarboxylate transport system permease small subunit